MPRLVLTGFGKFNGVENNPTTALVAHFREELAQQQETLLPGAVGDRYECHVLEVSVGAVDELYESAHFDFEDCKFVHLGVNSRATSIALEMQAWNDKSFRVPDERGYNPEAVPIDCNSELNSSLQSSYHIESLKEALTAEGHNVSLSQDPGRFLCNYIYYKSLFSQRSRRCPQQAIFVHVPPFEVISQADQINCVRRILQLLWKDHSDHLSDGEKKLRVGFMSTAGICSKNYRAICSTSSAVVSAVGSRDLSRAEAWAKDRGVERAVGSYDELLVGPVGGAVDAVYVPLPTTMRAEWVSNFVSIIFL